MAYFSHIFSALQEKGINFDSFARISSNALMSDFNVGTPNVIDARVKGVSRDEHSGIAFANFKAHKFSYLNITSLATVYVLNGRECGLACVNIPSCVSFNLAAFYDITGKILCELLPSDKYNNLDKFVTSKLFHHFSIRVSINSKLSLLFIVRW